MLPFCWKRPQFPSIGKHAQCRAAAVPRLQSGKTTFIRLTWLQSWLIRPDRLLLSRSHHYPFTMLLSLQARHVLGALASLFLVQVQATDATVAVSNPFQTQCLSFRPELFIANSTRTHLEYVTNGTTLLFPDNVASCGRASQLVSKNICRIALSIPTSYRSSITFELWLPDDWSSARRYVSTGNGGIDGCLCIFSLHIEMMLII